MGARVLNLVAIGFVDAIQPLLRVAGIAVAEALQEVTCSFTFVPPPTEKGSAWLAGVLAFPVLVAATPLAFGRRARVVAAVLLGVATLLAAASIGLFYVPAAATLAAAAAVGWPRA